MRLAINYDKSIKELLDKLKKLSIKYDNSFIGNEKEGSFEIITIIGNFRGKYSVRDKVITLIILSKPFFISKTRIEKEIKDFLLNN
jgi:hypothetical protein